jgi:hypothetical protein
MNKSLSLDQYTQLLNTIRDMNESEYGDIMKYNSPEDIENRLNTLMYRKDKVYLTLDCLVTIPRSVFANLTNLQDLNKNFKSPDYKTSKLEEEIMCEISSWMNENYNQLSSTYDDVGGLCVDNCIDQLLYRGFFVERYDKNNIDLSIGCDVDLPLWKIMDRVNKEKNDYDEECCEWMYSSIIMNLLGEEYNGVECSDEDYLPVDDLISQLKDKGLDIPIPKDS